MNKKAQVEGVLGAILVMFIGVLVGLILFQAVAQETGRSLNTLVFNDSSDGSTTTLGANGTRLDLTGQDLLSTPVVTNITSGIVVQAGNYTIDEVVSTSTGVKTISYLVLTPEYASQEVNITYTYGPDGYIDNAAARSIVPLITIFFALAIAVIALSPTMRGALSDMFK